jgi:hypothetical protein
LGRAFYAREELTFDQGPAFRQVFDDVTALRRRGKESWFLVAGKNSYILPFLTLKEGPWTLTPEWEQISKLAIPGKAAQSYVLVLNTPIPAGLPVEIVKQYADNTYVLRIRRD